MQKGYEYIKFRILAINFKADLGLGYLKLPHNAESKQHLSILLIWHKGTAISKLESSHWHCCYSPADSRSFVLWIQLDFLFLIGKHPRMASTACTIFLVHYKMKESCALQHGHRPHGYSRAGACGGE